MEENPLKPPLNENNLKTISKKVFGSEDAIKSYQPIPPYRKTSTYLCALRSGGKAILKYGPKEEWENQKIAAELALGAPEVIANALHMQEKDKDDPEVVKERVWFAQEFIKKSRAMHEMEAEGDSEEIAVAFEKATLLLARIHRSLDEFLKRKELPQFTEEDVVNELEERFHRITSVLDEHTQLVGAEKDIRRWKSYLKRLNREDLKTIFIVSGQQKKCPRPMGLQT